MESHEWFEKTDEGRVFYRANYLGNRWTIMTTMQKRNPEWTDIKPVPEVVWRELRDIVFNKYQRKRLPWERVAEIDRILGQGADRAEAIARPIVDRVYDITGMIRSRRG